MQYLKASELQLADVAELFENGYGTATVRKITEDGEITFFRPYVAASDFACGGYVICTIGIEEVVYHRSDSRMFKVVERKELK